MEGKITVQKQQQNQNNKMIDMVEESEVDPFLDLLLTKRYLIKTYFSRGFYGKLYRAKDMQEGMRDVLIKISSDLQKNKKEYDILKQLKKTFKPDDRKTYHFPALFGGGEFIVSDDQNNVSDINERRFSVDATTRHSFIVMEPLGQTLQHYLNIRKKAFSLKTTC